MHSEYHRKTRKLDRDFNQHPVDSAQSGPVSLKLTSFGRVRGLACGAFGEGSTDLHKLCASIATTAATTRFQDMGAMSAEQAYSRALRYVYRVIGMEMMKSAAILKQRRMGVVRAGPQSATAATSRRRAAANVWANDRLTYFTSHSYGGSRSYQRRW